MIFLMAFGWVFFICCFIGVHIYVRLEREGKWDSFDVDGSGSLDFDELKTFIQAGDDGDGEVTFGEFLKLFM